jgi:transcriptional regulator NrdR family protein
MKCQKCKKKAFAIDKVDRDDGIIYRKYKCKKCEQSFYTMEFYIIADSVFKEDWTANHRLTKLDMERKDGKCRRTRRKQTIKEN